MEKISFWMNIEINVNVLFGEDHGTVTQSFFLITASSSIMYSLLYSKFNGK